VDKCTDNRFELIEKYKNELIENTNINTSEKEMEVLESILFRFWQMGWLKGWTPVTVGDGSKKACAGTARSSSPGKLAIVVRVRNARRQWTLMTGFTSSS